ncbi:MAG: Dihydrolipoyllysine-residue acetyltransferase component of pyruvate dehydrogenase complex [Pseudomonadales bacterium]|nr:Dihydrolipoyllysine-residue acetyltransferase component of pyruvate dehydrogenase complex [Pseudomonadales bacterium]
MASKVVLPKWGMGLNEGTILKWLKTEGERVDEGEPIVEIETAKAVEEAPAPESGRLVRILVPEGQTVETFTTIAIVAEDGEDYADLLD